MTFRRVARRLHWPLTAMLVLFCLVGSLFAQSENLPPKPDQYITDQAGVIDGATLSAINTELEQFEKDTSNQIVVAIYPNLPPDADIDQYTIDTYNAWGIGQKGKDNGALLLIAVNDHKMFICTGRGLEGALPDAICKNIVTQVIAPQFKQGDYAGGVQAGVNAMVAATKGEYKGTGSTVDERDQQLPDWVIIAAFILFVLFITIVRPNFQAGPFIFMGGGYGGGYGGGGGGGGFSGGGGSSAGGGAGGGW